MLNNDVFRGVLMIRIPVETLAYWQSREGNFKKAPPETVAAVALLGGGLLPKDYLSFIGTYGFVPWEYTIPDSFDTRIDEGGQTIVQTRSISHLWSKAGMDRMLPNIWQDDPANGYPMLPRGVFPIGGTPGQDLILLEQEPQNGCIWYWRFNNAAWGKPGNQQLEFVADSFTDFINNLRMGPTPHAD
jgi:hypothetical protein